MRTAISSLLSGDGTLTGTLTGGVYSAGTVGEISRQTTPDAFDANEEVEPCGLLRFETDAPWGVHDASARLYFAVLLYERVGSSAIDTARARIYALLHRQVVAPDGDGGCWEIRHAGDTLDQEDPALGCGLAVCRYVATINKA